MTRRPRESVLARLSRRPAKLSLPFGLLNLALLIGGLSAPVWALAQAAQPAAPAAATGPAPATAAATPATAAKGAQPDPQSPSRVNTRGEPAVQQRVLEDEHIIIEELVVRGQPVRINVRGKAPGARGYEVNVGPGGRDASQESGRAGQSAWRLFSF